MENTTDRLYQYDLYSWQANEHECDVKRKERKKNIDKCVQYCAQARLSSPHSTVHSSQHTDILITAEKQFGRRSFRFFSLSLLHPCSTATSLIRLDSVDNRRHSV